MSAVADKYISVLMIQAVLDVECTAEYELCTGGESWRRQFDHSKSLIEAHNPDIVIYPETFYLSESAAEFEELSNGRLIVAGSTYVDKQNETIVFQDGKIHRILKNNPSPLEIASRYMPYQTFDSLIDEGLWNEGAHIFKVKGEDVLVLNCMEYYNSAYFISRSKKYNSNLFGILCPCSSSNMSLFEQETIAINNHREDVYTFLCNRISPKGKSTTKGGSYIYGMISRIEKDFIRQMYSGYKLEHICGIVKLGSDPTWVYGEYAIPEGVSPFGRSDRFMRTPMNLTVSGLNH